MNMKMSGISYKLYNKTGIKKKENSQQQGKSTSFKGKEQQPTEKTYSVQNAIADLQGLKELIGNKLTELTKNMQSLENTTRITETIDGKKDIKGDGSLELDNGLFRLLTAPNDIKLSGYTQAAEVNGKSVNLEGAAYADQIKAKKVSLAQESSAGTITANQIVLGKDTTLEKNIYLGPDNENPDAKLTIHNGAQINGNIILYNLTNSELLSNSIDLLNTDCNNEKPIIQVYLAYTKDNKKPDAKYYNYIKSKIEDNGVIYKLSSLPV